MVLGICLDPPRPGKENPQHAQPGHVDRAEPARRDQAARQGALNNGVSVEEIKEILLQATVYCGIPAGLDAFKVANQVLEEEGAFKEPRT